MEPEPYVRRGIWIPLPPETLQALDAARGTIGRISFICSLLSYVVGSFPGDERDTPVSAAQRCYVDAFEAHLRTDAGIDTAVEIAEHIAVKLTAGRSRRNRPGFVRTHR